MINTPLKYFYSPVHREPVEGGGQVGGRARQVQLVVVCEGKLLTILKLIN